MSIMKQNILIVDDNYDMLDVIQRHLKSFDYHTYKASSVIDAIDVLKYNDIHLLITDLNMPDIDGIELLKYTNEHYPLIPKLVVTGFNTIDNAINSIKAGALDYLNKPFSSDELQNAITKCLLKAKTSPKTLSNSINSSIENNGYYGIVGRSEHFEKLVEIINRVKDNNVNVLIEGESGTGKELIAKAIHYKGAFSKMPFISVNCGAIPENLIESEFFGYAKGAFTGASESKIGFFQAASNGTIFLDEIATAPLSVQTRLLRVIQEKEVIKVGSTKVEKINVRIICATNSDLHKMVLEGKFRADLYYRINVINIKTTPLRDKKEDLMLLINSFLKKYGIKYDKPNTSIDEKATEILLRYSWPGNVRELENIIQRMIILSDEIINVQHIPEHLKYHVPEKSFFFKSLKEFEKEHIIKTLTAVNNNKSKAAKILQIDRKTLSQKLS